MNLKDFKNEVDLRGWTLKHDPTIWPETFPATKTVHYRAVRKGERLLNGAVTKYPASIDEVLCHELCHIHLGHTELNPLSWGRLLELEAIVYAWARGMPQPDEFHSDFICICAVDSVEGYLSPVELKLARRWVGSCKHG